MNIQELIDLSEARFAYLSQLLNDAIRFGDIDAITRYQKEMTEVRETINKLKSL